ncbi:hypothetical protein NUW54_g159 [Trametes sanguinea]|uniref:Uncharacterized protein n=1 Tax=Trametes sanguinea TaxID=158606 RepID=A0ACC1QBB0_9APHY|nr:hypothetical protein NUW54_g159 [Trametes sanguinea]
MFVSQELQKANEEASADPHQQISLELIKEIASQWRTMSQEKHVNAVGSWWRGGRTPLLLPSQTSRTRTGILLIAVCNQFNRPYVFYMSKRITQFSLSTTAQWETINQFAMQAEAACIGDLESEVVRSCKDKLQDLKNRTAALISNKLKQASVHGQARKMFYVNFEEHIRLHHGVILEGWSTRVTFTAPGKFNSIPELQTLYTAWDTGATRSHSLTNTKWHKWILVYKKQHDLDAMATDYEDADDAQPLLFPTLPSPTPPSPASVSIPQPPPVPHAAALTSAPLPPPPSDPACTPSPSTLSSVSATTTTAPMSASIGNEFPRPQNPSPLAAAADYRTLTVPPAPIARYKHPHMNTFQFWCLTALSLKYSGLGSIARRTREMVSTDCARPGLITRAWVS